ncbi:hypothetical protein Nepgr_024004 [Nepenthes gracilis]|uniref:Uncharacterized protein n=1 Tax=Nepenthes gracilis TaxID=150966 RepID=A0AAD3T5D1_NEPGR|nr:hypothetical protein Nepgr_024004 [Nepenthes gracilis]
MIYRFAFKPNVQASSLSPLLRNLRFSRRGSAMAARAAHLKSENNTALKLLFRSPPIITFSHFSSSANNVEIGSENPQNTENKSSTLSSSFRDVKASLKQQQQIDRRPYSFTQRTDSVSKKPDRITSLEEIRRNLSEFRRRTASPDPSPLDSQPSSPPISLQELYKRNVMSRGESGGAELGNDRPGTKLSFEAIRESLRQLRSSQNDTANKVNDSMSLSKFKESLRLEPTWESGGSVRGSNVIGGTNYNLPSSVFGKELREMEKVGEKDMVMGTMKTEFVKMYSYGELGEKLRKLRPEGAKKEGENWFSLTELNERLIRLREMEEKESESRVPGVSFKELRESLLRLRVSEDEKAKKSTIQRLDILGQLGGTPSFMLSPPKEHLVEKYFHPDNLSSAEKSKIELKRVRDEFKMSESDCGSARVQIAQLTTEINHLSAVIHKKDKHSRKGLLTKVQKRKTFETTLITRTKEVTKLPVPCSPCCPLTRC